MSNIEDDLKVLEKFMNNETQRDKLERDNRCGGWKMGDIYKRLELNPAIKNILSEREQDKERIKELEEENGTLKRVNNIIKNIDIENATQKIDDYYNEFMRNFIPKQKIKEKINENSNMIREIEEKIKKEENSGDICEEYLSDLYKEKSLVERDILTLQELLQEEDK